MFPVIGNYYLCFFLLLYIIVLLLFFKLLKTIRLYGNPFLKIETKIFIALKEKQVVENKVLPIRKKFFFFLYI